MTGADAMAGDPWWASGSTPDDGLDDAQDPFDAHRRARQGTDASSDADDGSGPHDAADEPGTTGDAGRLASEAIDLVARVAAEAGRRISARSTAHASAPPRDAFTRPDDPQAPPPGQGAAWRRLADGIAPHADGEVCDACPVCIGLRAVRQARPDVIAHLSEAAHHVSLALRALADAQAADPEGLEKIDLDQ